MPAQTVIKFRRDTAANWNSANPVLAAGEAGFESDTRKLKIGNGSTAWTSLGYSNASTLDELTDVVITSAANGDVLQYNGTNWVNASIDALPSQSGNTGKYLTTDGTEASWGTIEIPPGTEISDTAPVSAEPGQLWWDSSTVTLYIYYDGFWVEAVSPSVGPQGPQGEPGVTGATGPAGPTGPVGADGSFSSTQTVETGSTRALTSADTGKLITNSAAITITVEGLSIGQQVDFLQTNAAQITFTPGAGITLNSKSGNRKTSGQYSPATVKCVATNSYVLLGDLAA